MSNPNRPRGSHARMLGGQYDRRNWTGPAEERVELLCEQIDMMWEASRILEDMRAGSVQ